MLKNVKFEVFKRFFVLFLSRKMNKINALNVCYFLQTADVSQRYREGSMDADTPYVKTFKKTLKITLKT